MRARALAVLASACLLLGAAGKDGVVVVEAVGVVSVDAEAADLRPSRDSALRVGLREAVYQVALGLLEGPPESISRRRTLRALGRDPLIYATRFRLLEDRGRQPRLLLEDESVSHEYIVIVEAHVHRGRVRDRLAEAGLLSAGQSVPEGVLRTTSVQVVLEDLPSYAVYEGLRAAWVEAGLAENAVPRIFERNRAVLDVRTSRYGESLARAMARSAPEPWRLVPIRWDARQIVLRVAGGPAGASGTVGWSDRGNPGSIDTQ